MNFKTEVGVLSASKNYILEVGSYKLIKVPVFSKSVVVGNRYYVLDLNDYVGAGSFGQVYKIYRIDQESGSRQMERPFAVKIFDTKNFNLKEAEIFRRYFFAEVPISHFNRIYFITEYFPGKELFQANDELHPDFSRLTLGQTLELIYQLCLSVNLLHHETQRTGSAILHCDIKGQNIRVNIESESSRINVYLYDFGLSDEVDDNPSKQLKVKGAKGSIFYIPSEPYFQKKRGLKSDIYSLVPIVIKLFGGSPFGTKQKLLDDEQYAPLVKAQYLLDGIFERFKPELASIPLPIADITKEFINRMQADYDSRPDSDQLLKFFTALNNAYKCLQAIHPNTKDNGEQAQFLAYIAMLIHYSKGQWLSPAAQSELFEKPEKCKAIINTYLNLKDFQKYKENDRYSWKNLNVLTRTKRSWEDLLALPQVESLQEFLRK